MQPCFWPVLGRYTSLSQVTRCNEEWARLEEAYAPRERGRVRQPVPPRLALGQGPVYNSVSG